MQEWQISFAIIRRNPPEKSTASFTIGGKPLGSIDVDHHIRAFPDMIFAEMMKYPHRWGPNLPDDLHQALLVYRKETIRDQQIIADADYREKTYRFLPITISNWRLTTDKSDIKIPKVVKESA